MTLEVNAAIARPSLTVDVAFSSPSGVTALFGPSGAGKSTVAGMIAGWVTPMRGRILLDGRVLVDRTRRVLVPQHRRQIATIFQDGRLFPHLSVRQNLLYGTWFDRRGGEQLDEIVDLLGLAPLLSRRPGSLSGGEQRRVAIGRALVSQPSLMILDEPLNGLDQSRKDEVLHYLERLKDGRRLPMLFITHALDDVVRLADTLVLVEAGRVAGAGPLDRIMPTLSFGSDRSEAGVIIVGMLQALDRQEALARIAFHGGTLIIPIGRLGSGPGADTPGRSMRIHLRARDVAIATELPVGLSILNVLPGIVGAVRPTPDHSVDVEIDLAGTRILSRITGHSARALGLMPGLPVYALIKSIALAGRNNAPERGSDQEEGHQG